MADFVVLKKIDFLGGEVFSDIEKGHYGVFCLEYGMGDAELNGVVCSINEGGVCLIASDDTFSFSAKELSSAVCICFDIGCLSTGKLLPLLEVFHEKDRFRTYNEEDGSELGSLVSKMEELSEAAPFYSQLLYAKLIELLCLLNTEEYTGEHSRRGREKISAGVIRYISENLQNSFTLEDIASSLFLSKYYMSHIFKKETGVSVGEMVFIKKMEYADVLLSSGVPAQRVSELCGFNSYSAFFRIYKRIKGHSPQTKLSEKRGVRKK